MTCCSFECIFSIRRSPTTDEIKCYDRTAKRTWLMCSASETLCNFIPFVTPNVDEAYIELWTTTCDHEDVNLLQFLLFRVNYSQTDCGIKHICFSHLYALRWMWGAKYRDSSAASKYDYILIGARYSLRANFNWKLSVWCDCSKLKFNYQTRMRQHRVPYVPIGQHLMEACAVRCSPSKINSMSIFLASVILTITINRHEQAPHIILVHSSCRSCQAHGPNTNMQLKHICIT